MQERLQQNDGVCNGSLVFSGSFTSSSLHLAWRGGRGGGALILRTMGRRTMSWCRTIEGMLFFMRLYEHNARNAESKHAGRSSQGNAANVAARA